MQISVKAGDGDEAAIGANVVSGELALVTFETTSTRSNLKTERLPMTLTVDQARELANALTSVADAVEFVRANEFALP